jgi:short-subunit dehydrogenase
MSVYAASKAFVVSFTEALTEECRPYNVTVMTFSPGYTTSNFLNTTANQEYGKTLVGGGSSQTPKQVAAEMIKALEKRKTFHVSGLSNSIGRRIIALIPNRTIAKLFAKQSRKKMKL